VWVFGCVASFFFFFVLFVCFFVGVGFLLGCFFLCFFVFFCLFFGFFFCFFCLHAMPPFPHVITFDISSKIFKYNSSPPEKELPLLLMESAHPLRSQVQTFSTLSVSPHVCPPVVHAFFFSHSLFKKGAFPMFSLSPPFRPPHDRDFVNPAFARSFGCSVQFFIFGTT